MYVAEHKEGRHAGGPAPVNHRGQNSWSLYGVQLHW